MLADVAEKFSPLLAANGQAVAATTISPAKVPGDPDLARRQAQPLLGGLLGLAIGIGLALVAHALDTKVRTEDDIKALSPRPILGDIPDRKSPSDGLLTRRE